MTLLDPLTDNQRNTIVSLPYRVGVWVSESDTSGGDDAVRQERQALSNIIHGFAEEMFGSETMQHIMSETLRKKDRWADWSQQVRNVPEDCRYAVDVMSEHFDAKDVNAFRMQLMEIGEAVALAFHERAGAGPFAAYMSYLGRKISGRGGRWRTRSFSDYQRISGPEHKALNALAQALGASY